MKHPYQYALIRVVPRVDRGEFVNAGVILFQPDAGYLKARTVLPVARLRALSATVDLEQVKKHLEAIERLCAGDPEAGPIAKMKKSDRFHWLTAPRSTMIQTSPIKTGLTESSDAELESLTSELVA